MKLRILVIAIIVAALTAGTAMQADAQPRWGRGHWHGRYYPGFRAWAPPLPVPRVYAPPLPVPGYYPGPYWGPGYYGYGPGYYGRGYYRGGYYHGRGYRHGYRR